ncbi:ABC transporter permease subunit, partial [bacterium]|nr:ABC transporter permease subunit [bacterium]
MWYRKTKNYIFVGFVFGLSFLLILPLVHILYYIVKNGISAINWDFIFNLPKPVGEIRGGIFNAIIGTVFLIGIACVMAVPLGVFAGVYLSEFGKTKLAYFTRLSVEVLQGVPSIVIGIAAYIWVVLPMGKFSCFAGAVALAVMMLPIIVRSTEETLNLIPFSLKEASMALGVNY